MKEALISIQGMTCAACSSSITDALEANASIERASVSLLTNEAKVGFNESISPDEVVRIVQDCGFDATLISVSNSNTNAMVANIQISGMTCGACSSSITEALEALPGVVSTSVSLITNSAKVIYDDRQTVANLLTVIEDCGFDAVLDSEHLESQTKIVSKFEVLGMTCGACSASITEALERSHGVISADVSQMTNAASVTHDSSLSAADIIELIEGCGFDATFVSSDQQKLNVLDDQREEIALQIYGLNESADLASFQHNVEAVLRSLGGIDEFHFTFKGQVRADDYANNTSDLGTENLIDELSVTLSANITGARDLIDSLNRIDDQIEFIILNSVDQTLSSQLKLLSRAKDIEYWKSNFLHSLLLGLPTTILSFSEDTKFLRKFVLFKGLYLVTVVEFLLATYILFHLGSVFIKKFHFFLRNKGKGANMDVLVCISILVSYLFSVLSMFLSVWTGQRDKPPTVLFETIAMLICFVSFGKWIENRAKGATSSALSKLMALTPTTCVIVEDEQQLEPLLSNDEKLDGNVSADLPTRTISIDLIQNNDVAMVSPGGKIPADGSIIYGSTEIDESIITGESLPVSKSVGDSVIGGSINGPFLIYMRVKAAGKKSQLHNIISIVKESQVNKAPIQRYADYIAARFVAFVLFLSLVTLIFWMICSKFFSDYLPSVFSTDSNGKYFVCLKLSISVIVVACPCALGLAAPTAVMVGTGVGATYGALIKGGDVMEQASGVNIVLFDKTGTLTSGKLSVINSKQMNAQLLTEETWWTLIGSVEINSEHPTGQAIAKYAKDILGMTFEEDKFEAFITNFEVLIGMGIRAKVTVDNRAYDVSIGSKKMVVKEFPEARGDLALALENELKDSARTVSHVVVDGSYCGFMELSDTIRPNTREAIDYLQHVEGFHVGMLTGDSTEVALKTGRELGIPRGNIFSEISPIEKDEVISRLREKFEGNATIAFVGDGINDAPALVQADIGMAISTGTDIAIDSAEIVLISSQGHSNELLAVITALQISQATFKKIKWNFFCATIYNAFMLPFAMGCFLKYGLILSPIAAAGAMACSSISVVLNSLLLKNWTPPNVRQAVANLIPWEEDIDSGISLSDATLADFKLHQRRTLRNGTNRVLALFQRKLRSRQQDYEMLSAV